MYLLAIICPPLALLLCKKPIQAVLNFFLCILFWIPGMIHALLVVKEYKADKNIEKQLKLIRNSIEK